MVAQVCINKERSIFHNCFHYSVHLLYFLFLWSKYCTVHTSHKYIFQVTSHSVTLHMYNKLLLSSMHTVRLLFCLIL